MRLNIMQSKNIVKKAIIPVAGFGTRFLPYTKSIPKEMLPIIDKPVVQFVVEEAISAGIEDIILVTGPNKRAIEDYFDYSYELEKRLIDFGKESLIPDINKPASLANFIYIRQKGPYGNAIPIKVAKKLVENEPFLVLWGDEFLLCDGKTRAQQVVEAYEKLKASVLCAFVSNDPEDTKKYAFVDGYEVEPGVWKVNRLIEKPGVGNAPTNIAIPSGYVLTPDIFPILDSQKPGLGGEYYLSEAIDQLAKSGVPVYAVIVEYKRYFDTGDKLKYMQAVIEMALHDPNIGDKIREYIKAILK